MNLVSKHCDFLCYLHFNEQLVEEYSSRTGQFSGLDLQWELEYIFSLEQLLERMQFDITSHCRNSCCTISFLLCRACMPMPICRECLSLYIHMHWRRGWLVGP